MIGQIVILCALALAVPRGTLVTADEPAAGGGELQDVKSVTACGTVVTYDCSKPTNTVLLELDTPDVAGLFGIGVPAALRSVLGDRFEEGYLGAEMCATGNIEKVDGHRVIVAAAPASLSVRKAAPRGAAPFAPGALQPCTAGVELPVLTSEARPEYTREAMRAEIQGTVALEAVVLPDGKVGEVRVIRSLDRDNGLDQSAIGAAKRWRFKPGTSRGQPMPVIVRIDLTFTLK